MSHIVCDLKGIKWPKVYTKKILSREECVFVFYAEIQDGCQINEGEHLCINPLGQKLQQKIALSYTVSALPRNSRWPPKMPDVAQNLISSSSSGN